MITRIEKFGASWCGPCKILDQILEKVSGVEIIKYDVDKEEELVFSKNIRNIPVLIYYNEVGQEVIRTIGATPLNSILEYIESY